MTANTNETNKIQLCEYSVLEGKLAMAYQIWDEMMDRGMANGDDEYFDKLTSELEAQLDSCPKPSDRKSKKSAEVELPEAPTVEPKKDKDGNAIVKEMSTKHLREALVAFRDENNVSLKCILGGKGYSAEAMANEYLRVTGYTFKKALTKTEQAKLDKANRPVAPTVKPNGQTVEISAKDLKPLLSAFAANNGVKLNVKVTSKFEDLAAEYTRVTGIAVTKKPTKAELKSATKKAETNKKEKQVTEKIASGTFYTAVVKGKQLAVEVVNSKGADFIVRELNKDGTSNPNGKLHTVARDRVFKLSTIEKLQAA